MSAPCPRGATGNLGDTDFTERDPVVLTLMFPEHLSNVVVKRVWAFTRCGLLPRLMAADLKENQDLIVFDNFTTGSLVMVTTSSTFKPPVPLHAWAMFLKSRKLCLAHSRCKWKGKEFGPNPVAWVGFKSLSEMSSLEPGIWAWHLWSQMRFHRLKAQEEVWITSY